MPITTDFTEFVEGCKKNKAVDYKVLYEKSQSKIEVLEETFEDLRQDFENAGKENAEKIVRYLTMIDKLKEETKDKDEIFESMKQDVVSLQKSFQRARQNQIQYREIIQKLTVGIILANGRDEFQEEIKIANETSPMWHRGMTRDEAETYNEILDEMNQDDWNEDGGMCCLKYDYEEDCIQYFMNDEEEEEEESEESSEEEEEESEEEKLKQKIRDILCTKGSMGYVEKIKKVKELL